MKKNLRSVVLVLVVLVAGSFAAWSQTSAPSESKDSILIGTLLPKSGPGAVFGQAIWQGFEIARIMINERGGIDGRMVVFANADAPDPTAAATEAERLISQENVKIIMGSMASGNALAASAVAQRNNVIYWETTSVTDKVTDNGYSHVFRVVEKASYRGIAAMNAIATEVVPLIDKKVTDIRVAIATEDSAYGQAQGEAAEKRAGELGLKVVARESYPATSTDLSACVLKLKAAKADVLFAVGYVNDTNLFWNTARQYKLKFDAVVGGGSGYTDQSFAKIQGDFAQGVMDIDTPSGIPMELFKSAKVRKDAARFRTLYKEMNNTDSVNFAAEIGWSGAWVLTRPGASCDERLFGRPGNYQGRDGSRREGDHLGIWREVRRKSSERASTSRALSVGWRCRKARDSERILRNPDQESPASKQLLTTASNC